MGYLERVMRGSYTGYIGTHRDYVGFPKIKCLLPTIMENQMDKNTENGMEAGFL